MQVDLIAKRAGLIFLRKVFVKHPPTFGLSYKTTFTKTTNELNASSNNTSGFVSTKQFCCLKTFAASLIKLNI